MVNALVAGYGMLDLGNLSWAYWHACAATAHIAPVQFGAAIEALQQAYIRSHPGEISTRILAPAQWDRLRSGIGCIIADADLSEDSKRALDDNLSVINLNKVPQRRVLKQILDDIGPSARQ